MNSESKKMRASVVHRLRLVVAVAVVTGAVVLGVSSSAVAATCAVGSGNCPGAPTSVVASVSSSASGSALVTWVAPSDVGSGITGYAITAYQGATNAGTTTVGNQTSATVSGLTNGDSYTFTVAGAVATGYGAVSSPSNAVVPATVPGAPTAVTASPGNASATVSWIAPGSDGGAAVSSYKVTASPGGFSATVGGAVLNATVSGLANGTAYTFSVVATNSQGSGAASAPSSAVTPSSGTATVPGTPAAPTGVGGSGQVTLTWSAPASTGGAAITSYSVKAFLGSGAGATLVDTVSVTAPSTSVVVTGLANGSSYTFDVAAVNSVGTGTASPPSSSIAVAASSQTISFTNPGPGTLYGTANLSATATSGLTVVFSVSLRSTNGACSVTGTQVTYTGAGTCVIDANQAGNTSYAAAPVVRQSVTVAPGTLTITAANHTITFGASTPANSSSVSGFVGSDAASVASVTYTYVGSGGTSYSASTTAPTGAGTYTVTPSAATLNFSVGSASNYTYSYVAGTYTINQATAVLAFASAPTGVTYGEAPGTHSVSAGATPNQGSVVYSSATTGVCSVNLSTGALTIWSSGTCTIDANDAGNANATAATQVAQNVTVAPGNLTITAASHTITFGDTTPANSSSLSGLVASDAASFSGVVYTYAGSGYTASTTAPTTAGTYTVTPSAATITFSAGSASNYVTVYVAGTYVINKAPVVLAFASAPTGVTYGEAPGTHSVSAGATPNQGSVVYSSATPGVCSVNASSGALTIWSSGTCAIDANDAGNADYAASAQVTQSIVVMPGASGGGSSTPTTGPVNAPPPSGIIPDDLGTPTSVTASGTLPTTDSISAGGASDTITVPAGALPTGTTLSAYPITNSSSLVSLVPTGQSYVVALAVSWQAPDGSSPAASVPITITIDDPNIVAGDVIYELTSAGLTEVGVASVNNEVTFSFTSDPTFIVAHAQAQSTPPALIAQAPLSVTSVSGTLGQVLTLTTSGGSGTGALAFTVTNGTATGCALAGDALSALSAGTCLVTATKAADSTYLAISSVATAVALALPARPATLTLGFKARSSALSMAQQRALSALAAKLLAGASITVSGYARANAKLAGRRVAVVVAFLATKVKVHVTRKTYTHGAANKITVVTTQQ